MAREVGSRVYSANSLLRKGRPKSGLREHSSAVPRDYCGSHYEAYSERAFPDDEPAETRDERHRFFDFLREHGADLPRIV